MVAIGTNIIALPSSGSGGGIYRSTDNGLYWAKVTVGFGLTITMRFALVPVQPLAIGIT